jgi:hypothetical protein
MQDHLEGDYGGIMYYCLRDRDEMRLKSGLSKYYGSGNPTDTEFYLTKISEMLFDQETTYIGKNYRRMWGAEY